MLLDEINRLPCRGRTFKKVKREKAVVFSKKRRGYSSGGGEKRKEWPLAKRERRWLLGTRGEKEENPKSQLFGGEKYLLSRKEKWQEDSICTTTKRSFTKVHPATEKRKVDRRLRANLAS